MGDTNERLAELETKVQHFEDFAQKNGFVVTDIKVLMKMVESIQAQLSDFLENGTSQCKVEQERLNQLVRRVEKLEQGEFPAMVTLRDNYERISDELCEIKSRLAPLEKRILMWVGALGFIALAAPFVFRYLTSG